MPSAASEPRIRFFTGAQGQRIAYAISGSGPPLVLPAWWVSHVERDWANEKFRAFFAALAANHTVVRYDRPGVGLSVRERTVFTLDSEVAQVEALVDHLGFERVSILGFSCGGPPAITYAARHPERVERIVLVGSYALGTDLTTPEVIKALTDLVRAHWGLGSQTISDLFAPDLEKKAARDLARSQHDWTSAELAAQLLQLSFDMDCRASAPLVRCPALVLHRRKDQTVMLDAGRALAALLGDAEFRPLDGNAHVPWEGDIDELVAEILGFLASRSLAGDRATRTAAPSAEESVWQREGELWRIQFDGHAVHLPTRKGLEDLAVLLTNPMREIPACELWMGPASGEASAPAAPTGADDVLDERARREIANRARELEADLEDAQARHDLGRLETLRAERETLLDTLQAAAGLGGRARRLGDPSERARKAVSARIRDALKRVREVHPALADHLDASITTGLSCAYRPEPARTWRI